MRQHDRPEPGIFSVNHDNLAERLLRLPDRHPSSPAGDWEDARTDESGYPDDPVNPDGAGPDGAAEIAGEEERPGQAETGEHGPEVSRVAAPRPVAGGGRDRSGRSGEGPYRPWFADAGPGEPWFAARPDGGPASQDG